MKLRVLVFGAVFAGPFVISAALAEPPEPAASPKSGTVVVTGEMREEAFRQQEEAERAAGDARKAFAALRNGGDRAEACRKAGDANVQYGMAIGEMRKVNNLSELPEAKANTGQRVEGMTERRKNLSDMSDRICKGSLPGARQAGARVRNPRGRP